MTRMDDALVASSEEDDSRMHQYDIRLIASHVPCDDNERIVVMERFSVSEGKEKLAIMDGYQCGDHQARLHRRSRPYMQQNLTTNLCKLEVESYQAHITGVRGHSERDGFRM